MNYKPFLYYCRGVIKVLYTKHKAYYNAIRFLRKSGVYEGVDLERAEWIWHISKHTILTLDESSNLYYLAHNILGLSKEDIVRLYPNDGTSLYDFKQSLLRGEYL